MTGGLRIGVDMGGVITRLLHTVADEDTAISDWRSPEQALALQVPGAIAGVRQLVELANGGVWIVSKAGPKVEDWSREWLHTVGFFGSSGLWPSNLRFCRQREDKAGICQELQLTHFIDDRVHVMQILRNVVPHLILFNPSDDDRRGTPWATAVKDWPEAVAAVRASIAAS